MRVARATIGERNRAGGGRFGDTILWDAARDVLVVEGVDGAWRVVFGWVVLMLAIAVLKVTGH